MSWRYEGAQALGYFYFEEEPGWRSAAKLLARSGHDPVEGGRRAAWLNSRYFERILAETTT
jgi:hypothetical protein